MLVPQKGFSVRVSEDHQASRGTHSGGHVSHVRFCARTRAKNGTEKRRAAGQGGAPHLSYVGDTT